VRAKLDKLAALLDSTDAVSDLTAARRPLGAFRRVPPDLNRTRGRENVTPNAPVTSLDRRTS
jgi:hypothetical protein